jgi:hypothetical protein
MATIHLGMIEELREIEKKFRGGGTFSPARAAPPHVEVDSRA